MGNLIPEQREGKKVDLSSQRVFKTKAEAVHCFARAYDRLLTPDLWHDLSGPLSAEFFLVPPDGSNPDRLAKAEDYIKIDVVGPGSSAGKGYDWVRIERIEDKSNPDADDESIGIQLRPTSDPKGENKNIAHFFTKEATSTFIISRKGTVVTACYYGRNEVPQTNAHNVIDSIRNAIVGLGAWASLSETQWTSLIKGFLQGENDQ